MPSILVVDDSAIDLKRASLLLQKHISEARILTAVDGQVALEIMEQEQPQVVVTDLQMPVLDGLELVVKAKEKFPLIPVVLMTAAGSEAIASNALRIGAASYVPKNQLANDLSRVVSRLLGAARERHNQFRILGCMTEVSFCMDNDRDLLVDFVHHFRELMQKRAVFSENDCFRVSMAVDEALANAYYHGNLEVSSKLREQDSFSFDRLAKERRGQEPYSLRKIYLSLNLGPVFRVVIRDEGPGFDQESLPDPFDPSFVERPCGRGVVLMRSFMDTVEFNDRGNEVTMTKQTNLETA